MLLQTDCFMRVIGTGETLVDCLPGLRAYHLGLGLVGLAVAPVGATQWGSDSVPLTLNEIDVWRLALRVRPKPGAQTRTL